ncbi:MAG: fibrobacter succinogenes major paralogous domain-containing protein [Bacteroidales bacterium]|nr:fibrobacter succinogenes major paralogous domain-containing protein [Bacteroidales bacterium]
MKRFNIHYLLFGILLSLIISFGCKEDDNTEETPEETTGTFTDARDGTTYKWVKICDQTWMAENLAYEPSSGNYWAYNDNEIFVDAYGYLYDWETAKSIAPEGWHLPSKAEWQELINCLGGENIAGGKMKESGNTHWIAPNTGATNSSGFTALPGGLRDSNGNYGGMNGLTVFWFSTAYNNNTAYIVELDFDAELANVYNGAKDYGFSVRCIKD